MIKDWKNKPQSVDMIRGKKVAVLGLGVEGLTSAKYLYSRGASVTILDAKEESGLDEGILSQVKEQKANLHLGKQYLEGLSQFDVIVRSPGIRRNLNELIDASKKDVLITSQTKLFFDLCPCPIIGVTGTKGKGTTASLVYEMLKNSGKDAYLGGNIGKPPFEFLDTLKPQSIVVLELSSFQLQDLEKSPHIGVMLMVTSEHLDYHGDTQEYVEAKRNILRFQTVKDFAILNRDYPAVNESDIITEAKVFFVSREREVDRGCYVKDKAVWLRMNGGEKKVIDTKDILLPGKHNLENVCAASLAAILAGVSLEDIKKAILSFRGLEHRLELVREVRGVAYYNDSFSTTPETVIAAIEAFDEPGLPAGRQVILILGGSSKKSDFGELGKVIAKAKNIKTIIGIGEEWMRIKSALRTKNLEQRTLLVEGAKDMKTIVAAADKIAKSGDVVLLSPGCASFGMFKNYKDRGEQFKREVEKLN